MIGERARVELTRWLSARYVRAAFPDAFNERISHAKKLVTKAIQKNGEFLSGIYFYVSNDELSDNEIYEMQVRGTMHVDDHGDVSKRSTCTQLLDTVVGTINKCTGIEVYDHQVVSEEFFSLDDLRLMKRWDWDHVSLKPDPPDAMVPEL